MFDHVTLAATDQSGLEAFYRCVLGALGSEPTESGSDAAGWQDFRLVAAGAGRAPTRNVHIGFVAWSREAVDRFWQAGVDAGYRDAGPPGERPQYKPSYYGAFLLDPAGNSIEAVHHDDVRRGGLIDHLWLGVRDLDAAVAFYQGISRDAGLRAGAEWPGGSQFLGRWASFALIADGRPPTSGLELCFPAPDRAAADAFGAAGRRDRDGNTVTLTWR